MMKYWHEISDKEFDKIHTAGKGYTWDWALKHYKQPDWCTYPQAIHPLGCWSLIDRDLRKKISPQYCKTCDLSKFFITQKTPVDAGKV